MKKVYGIDGIDEVFDGDICCESREHSPPITKSHKATLRCPNCISVFTVTVPATDGIWLCPMCFRVIEEEEGTAFLS